MNLFALRTVTDLDIADDFLRPVLETVAVAGIRREAGAHARPQDLFARIGHQGRRALGDVDEFVFRGVPVAQ